MRAARRTRIRLCVKAPVARVVVFRLTCWTHREFFHRGVRSVVRQGFDDAETRAAVGAIRERITKAPVLRIKNFAQTIGARGDVGQHKRGFAAAGFAGAYFKFFKADGVQPGCLQALNETARRFFGFKPAQKFFKLWTSAFNLDKNALRRIVDPAVQQKLSGEAVNERPEANALHCAAHGHFYAHGWLRLAQF